jgi:hypothetical protein
MYYIYGFQSVESYRKSFKTASFEGKSLRRKSAGIPGTGHCCLQQSCHYLFLEANLAAISIARTPRQPLQLNYPKDIDIEK